MEKISSAYGSYFALREEAGHRNPSQSFLHDRAVMVGAPEQAFTAPTAAEEQSPERGMTMFGAIRGKQDVQVVAGGFGVAKLELHGLAFLDEIANRESASFLIRSDEIAHEKISAFEAAPMLIHGYADMQGTMGIPTLRPFQRLEHLLQPSQRWSPAEFKDHILLRPRNDIAFSDGAAPLRDYRSDRNGTGQLHADQPSIENFSVSEEPVFSGA